MMEDRIHGTTILALKRGGRVVMGGDGQVSLGNTVLKHTAVKIRRLHGGRVITGFAGATADAFTLFEKLESKLEEFKGNLARAAVELAKEWRTDKILRRLEAMLIAADAKHCLLISGSGDIIEPEDGVVAIGSGGPYALAAAKALMAHTDLPPREMVRTALEIAASICVFTNTEITIEELECEE